MRKSIERRKDFIVRKKLRRKYPGRYKVYSDYGYGDISILYDYLTIDKAIDKMCFYCNIENYSISNVVGYRLEIPSYGCCGIVPQEEILRCEEPGFDWMDS
jgi:hypothetical protein